MADPLCSCSSWQLQDLAVANEDYDEAKKLKASIERLKVCTSTSSFPSWTNSCPMPSGQMLFDKVHIGAASTPGHWRMISA
jgi:hypothetical protein